MKKYLLIIVSIIIADNLCANGDTLTAKQHTIYIIPTNIFRDAFEGYSCLWMSLGYDYKLNKRNFAGTSISTVIYSEKSNAGILSIPAEKVTGYSINLEHKIILKKHFYYSTNLFYQHTKIYEVEVLYIASNVTNHPYYILRDIDAITSKIGFAFFSHNHIFYDIGIGVGAKYIKSKTIEKISPTYIYYGGPKGSYFGYENVVKPNFILQFKIGYNF